jgi:hypothetical protein
MEFPGAGGAGRARARCASPTRVAPRYMQRPVWRLRGALAQTRPSVGASSRGGFLRASGDRGAAEAWESRELTACWVMRVVLAGRPLETRAAGSP